MTTPEHPYGIALDQYVKNVSSASGGALKLTTIPTYSGGSDVQLLQDVSDGAVEMASVSAAVWPGQGVTSFQALQALGLINRYDLEGQVIGGPIGTEMLKGTDAIGVKGLAIHEGGFRVPVGAKAALTDAASWKGKSIRVPESSVLETGISALGADPNPLPLGDVYTALREGTVDGMEANLGLIVTQKFYEVAGFITAERAAVAVPDGVGDQPGRVRRADGRPAEDPGGRGGEAARALPGDLQPPSDFPKTVCDNGMKFVIASDAALADFGKASTAAIAELSKDATTKGFIGQIQDDQGRPAPGARPAAAA